MVVRDNFGDRILAGEAPGGGDVSLHPAVLLLLLRE